MRLSLSLIVAVATSVNAASFFTGEWAENLKHFFRQTQQSIEQKSGHLLAELSKKVDSAQNFVQRSKSAFSTLAQNLKSGSEKLKATVMETAETTLRGAGDEVPF
ncbi:unnamed protein product [Gongylonema pulchrum]|uniref:Apolipoprotein C-I n=1 Tax=Gongylonema pulchrum TaxID=637853 RepID=A0A183CZ97_9BILA|nr:unnamed protein product [Gongylonema pulchrum]